MRHEEIVEEILRDAERIDEEEDRLYGNKDGYSLDRQFTEDDIKKALKKLNREKDRVGAGRKDTEEMNIL